MDPTIDLATITRVYVEEPQNRRWPVLRPSLNQRIKSSSSRFFSNILYSTHLARSEDRVKRLYSWQVGQVSRENLKLLGHFNVKYVDPENIRFLELWQVGSIKPEYAVCLEPRQVPFAHIDAVSYLSPRQLKYIAPSQVPGVPATSVRFLDRRYFPFLDKDQVNHLLPEHFQLLNPDQIKWVSKNNIQYLLPEQIKYLKPFQVCSLQTRFYEHLEPDQLVYLQPSTVDFLPTRLIPYIVIGFEFLSPTKLKYLTNDQVEKISPGYANFLEPRQIRYISQWAVTHLSTEKLIYLRHEQIQYLDEYQIQSLRKDLIKYLYEEQIPWLQDSNLIFLSPSQIKYLKPEKLHFLTIDQLRFITNEQISSITDDYVDNFSDEQIDVISKNQGILFLRSIKLFQRLKREAVNRIFETYLSGETKKAAEGLFRFLNARQFEYDLNPVFRKYITPAMIFRMGADCTLKYFGQFYSKPHIDSWIHQSNQSFHERYLIIPNFGYQIHYYMFSGSFSNWINSIPKSELRSQFFPHFRQILESTEIIIVKAVAAVLWKEFVHVQNPLISEDSELGNLILLKYSLTHLSVDEPGNPFSIYFDIEKSQKEEVCVNLTPYLINDDRVVLNMDLIRKMAKDRSKKFTYKTLEVALNRPFFSVSELQGWFENIRLRNQSGQIDVLLNQQGFKSLAQLESQLCTNRENVKWITRGEDDEVVPETAVQMNACLAVLFKELSNPSAGGGGLLSEAEFKVIAFANIFIHCDSSSMY